MLDRTEESLQFEDDVQNSIQHIKKIMADNFNKAPDMCDGLSSMTYTIDSLLIWAIDCNFQCLACDEQEYIDEIFNALKESVNKSRKAAHANRRTN